MKLCFVSDMHGNLKFTVDPCDILLIGGDICPATHDSFSSVHMQHNFLKNSFYPWISKQPIEECVFVFGNHDWIGEDKSLKIPKTPKNCHYLEDSEITIFGQRIYGTPVQLPFNDWAFNRREEIIQLHWDKIPEGLDILLLHSPPYGIFDQTDPSEYESTHIGSQSLKKKIEEVRPKIVVFGHNHGDHGMKKIDDIIYVNASLLNEQYKMDKKPIYLEI